MKNEHPNDKEKIVKCAIELLSEMGPLTADQMLQEMLSRGIETSRTAIPGTLRYHARSIEKKRVWRYKDPYGKRRVNVYFLKGDPRAKNIKENKPEGRKNWFKEELWSTDFRDL